MPPLPRRLAWLLLPTLGLLGLWYFGRLHRSPPLPPELSDPEVADQERDEALKRLLRECPADRRPVLIRRLSRLDNGKELARGFLMRAMDDDPGTADPVLAAYLNCFEEPHWGPLWTIKLKIKQRNFDEAARLFRERRAEFAEDEAQRRGVLYSYLEYMTEGGRPVAGYEAADPPDAAFAFRVVAEFLEHDPPLVPEGQAALSHLSELIAAHRARAGETPWTAYYTGVLREGEKNDEEAQTAYADAGRRLLAAGLGPTQLQKAGILSNREDRTWDFARRRRVFCLLRLGRWEQAYDECEPPAETFNDLTQQFEIRKDWDTLSRLVTRHRARVPGDPRADLWQAVAYFGGEEYEPAIAAVDRYLPTVKARPFQDHRAFWIKFRSQLRLGRVENARRTFEAEARHTPHLIAQMLLAAHTGDVPAMEHIFAEHARYSSDPPKEYYDDEDLGPLLRSERFAVLRKKYPPETARGPER